MSGRLLYIHLAFKRPIYTWRDATATDYVVDAMGVGACKPLLRICHLLPLPPRRSN